MAEIGGYENIGRATTDYAESNSEPNFQHLIRASSDMAVARSKDALRYANRFVRQVALDNDILPAATSFYFPGGLSQPLGQNLTFNTSTSVSIWLRFDADLINNSGVYSNNNNSYLEVLHGANPAVRGFRSRVNNQTTAATAQTLFSANIWYNVVLVRGAGNDSQIYVNGVLRGSSGGNFVTWNVTHLGVRTTNARFFKGYLTQVSRINKRMLLADCVEMYNGGIPPDLTTVSFSALVLNWYKLGEGDTALVLKDTITSATVPTNGIVSSTVYPS